MIASDWHLLESISLLYLLYVVSNVDGTLRAIYPES